MGPQVVFCSRPNSVKSYSAQLDHFIMKFSCNHLDSPAIMEPSEETRGVNLISLLQSGKFSDLQLSCEGGDFAVHKAILCAQSRVISAECEGGFEVRPVVNRSNIICLLI